MRVIAIILVCFLSSVQLPAQIEVIKFEGEYLKGVSPRIGATDASGYGGGLEIRFRLIEDLSISLRGGFQNFTVEQSNAITWWNWRFWNERYRNYIQSILQTDTALTFRFDEDQYLRVTPLMLTLNYRLEIDENLVVMPYVGGGLFFFTRRLDLIEKWSKYYPSVDHVFAYEYRNFAEPKRGNPYLIAGGVDITYKLFNFMALSGGGRVVQLVGDKKSRGFNNLPFLRSVTASVGLTFLY